ncbi:hypothetical protein BJ166DRAFT_57196 [Pestalotiopsis sp. NC0098]|nr:hypothetical protein BJ166DRAFT_57196 [Pestalotiopsis sp. NC0098]
MDSISNNNPEDIENGASYHHTDQENHSQNILSPQTGQAPTSLASRAPFDVPLKTTWEYWWQAGPHSQKHTYSVLHRKDQCIRSKIMREERPKVQQRADRITVNQSGTSTTGQSTYEGSFPYPSQYQVILNGTSVRATSSIEAVVGLPAITKLSLGLKLKRSVEANSLGQFQPIYVVMGIFRHGQTNPQERVVFVYEPGTLFSRLRWAAFRLRGFRGTFLSLKHVVAFQLYRCDAVTGTHELVALDNEGVADLKSFLATYRQWRVSDRMNQAWAEWIHHTMNNRSRYIHEGDYMLGIVLGWSVRRITVVICFPILVSLAIGIWINSNDWTDLATIQTAWGTASYILTAGGLFAALLAILSGISDT